MYRLLVGLALWFTLLIILIGAVYFDGSSPYYLSKSALALMCCLFLPFYVQPKGYGPLLSIYVLVINFIFTVLAIVDSR